jgi:translation initiation factor 1
MAAKKQKHPLQDSAEFAPNPFDALSGTGLPAGPTDPEPPGQRAPAAADFIVHRERQGRGGKDVTLLTCKSGSEDLQLLARTLRRHLGTGGTVRDDVIELQGDQRQPVATYLRAAGHRVRGDLQ